jgi:uncharacterized protein
MHASQTIADGTRPLDPAVAPLEEAERIVPLDVLRGLALLGILLMNIQAFSMIGAAYSNPTSYGDLRGANWWVWLLCRVFADQKFMTIFSMLFGAGILLMTRRIEARGLPSARLHYRRMGWLLLFGLLHGFLLWDGDILFVYGVGGLVVYLFRKMAPWKQLLLAAVLLAVGSGISLGSYYSLRWWPAEQRQELKRDIWRPTQGQVAHELLAFRAGYISELRERAPGELRSITQGLLFWGFWRATGLMLAGMAMFKLGVFSAKRSQALYAGMIAAAAVAGVPIILYGVHREIGAGWNFGYSFFVAEQYNYFASILVSFGWLGLVMLACQSAWWLARLRPLAAVGRMAFSNYILHTLICTTIFYGFGFGLFGKVARTGQIELVLAIWILQLMLSPVWLSKFQYGPLEWLWRSLTYGKRQPLFRSA